MTYKNEKGIFFVFFPSILTSLVFHILDIYTAHSNFPEAQEYFKSLYFNRFLIFILILLGWRHIKAYISGYLLLFIFYTFNIMIVISDIFNIYMFEEKYKMMEGFGYYRIMKIKNLANYCFLMIWLVLLLINLKRWYDIYKRGEMYHAHEGEVNDTDVEENAKKND